MIKMTIEFSRIASASNWSLCIYFLIPILVLATGTRQQISLKISGLTDRVRIELAQIFALKLGGILLAIFGGIKLY